MHKIWQTKQPDAELSQRLVSELKISPLVAQLLVNRGVIEPASAQEFLYPDLSYLHPPSKMKGISDAAERVKRAISGGEKIWVYGDYDVDGITAVSLMLSCLKRLGADVDYYIPHRLDEGYGLSQDGIAELKEKGCNLLITVDCGIGAAEEVRTANEAGIDVIITDHHVPRDDLPPALVTLNPKLEDCGYPFENLAGVGMAFKLAQAVMGDENGDNKTFLRDQLDLVALGTIADVVPLMGENRIIAKFGLEVLNRMERIGIRALCEVSGVKEGDVNVGAVGFRLGPRINAAGRIDTAHSAVHLLTTDSYEEALEIAKKLDEANKERQSIERSILGSAIEQANEFDLVHEKGLVLASEGWHPGVIGIVASRIQERYYRPAILIALEGDQGRGSARSIPEFDIFDAIAQCSHLLERFGGHRAAAGLSIAKENIGKFRKEFANVAKKMLGQEDLKPKVVMDVETSIRDLSLEVVEQLSLLEPHGMGNPRPLVKISALDLRGLPRVVGNAGQHLQMRVSDGQTVLKTIAFNKGDIERELYDDDVKLDLACRPMINVWNDMSSVELRVEEIVVHHEGGLDLMAASAELVESSPLKVIDRRNIPDKRQYLKKLLNLGEKTLMYVRDDPAVDQLERIVSKYAPNTRLNVCYSATPEDERDHMKLTLIDGGLDAIASSIPFVEPLSGLRHLVFCHPVPTRYDFARYCAPAVESEELAYVHLIFNSSDVDFLTEALSHQYPDRQMLANVYRKVRELSDEKSDGLVTIEEIAAGMELGDSGEMIVSNCIAIFEEVNLAERKQVKGKTAVSLPPAPQERRDLKESQLYANGDRIRSEWAKFSGFILKRTAEDIRKMLLEMVL